MKVNFEINGLNFEFSNAGIGKETIIVDGKPVSEKRSLGGKTKHEFIYENQEYEVNIKAISMPIKVNIIVKKDGNELYNKWFDQSGTEVSITEINSIKKTSVFSIILIGGAIAIGGILPYIIGFAGAGICILIGKRKKLSNKLIYIYCTLVTILCVFILFASIYGLGQLDKNFGILPLNRSDLENQIQKANNGTPIKIDSETMFVGGNLVDDTLFYNFELINVDDINSTYINKEIVIDNTSKNSCNNKDLKFYLNKDIWIGYKYFTTKKEIYLEFKIDPNQCK